MGSFSIEKDLSSNTNDPWIQFSKEKEKVFNSSRFESSAFYLFKNPTGYFLEDLFPTEKFSTNYLFNLEKYYFSPVGVRYLSKYFNNSNLIKIQGDPSTNPIFPRDNLCATLNDSGDIGFIVGSSGIHVLNKINNNWLTATCFGNYEVRDLKCNSSGNILFVSTVTGVSIYSGYSNDWKHLIKLTGDYEPYEIDCNQYGNILAFGSVVSTVFPPNFPPDFTQIKSGAFYIWKEENSNWILKNTITGTGFDFGKSISMDSLGNTIITSCTRAATVDGLYKSGQLTITTGNGEEWKINQVLCADQLNDNFGHISKINKKGNRIFCSAWGGPTSTISRFHTKSKIHIYTGDKIFYKASEVSGAINASPGGAPFYEIRPGFGFNINTNEDGNVLFVGCFTDATPYREESPLFVYEKQIGLESWRTGVMSVGQKIGLDRYAKNFIISNSIFPTNFNSGYYYSSTFEPEMEVYENTTNNKISFYKEYNYWTDYNKYKTGGYILSKDCRIKFLNFNNSGVHINELNSNLELYKHSAHLSFGEII